LIVDAMATTADGFAERDAAMLMLHEQWKTTPGRSRTVGADKGYDTHDFVMVRRELHVTPHVTQTICAVAAVPSTRARPVMRGTR
jgi:hypothetical protein